MDSFLEEDEAIEMAIQEAGAVYFRNDHGNSSTSITKSEEPGTRCLYCGTLSGDERLLRDFGLSVCFSCKSAHREEFRCISKSKAMKKYKKAVVCS